LILALVDDLFFRNLIEESARSEGERCLILKEETEIEEALRKEIPKVLLMDVGVSNVDVPSLIEKLKQNSTTRTISLVVFGSSIRGDLMQDARELGADQVLPKASFKQQLPEIIRRYQKKKDLYT
jgi:CheY-like chemotaxis protein